MATDSGCECKPCIDESRFPNAFVVHLEGTCCRCAEPGSKDACGTCKDSGDCASCASLNQSVVVRREGESTLCYVHKFENSDFAADEIPCGADKLTLRLTKQQKDKDIWYSVCVVLSFSDGQRPVAWYRPKIDDCCNFGPLRRHAANDKCQWPKSIQVNGVPTPDYVPPQPEWARGNPDDLNDADYWPSLDLPLMQDSPDVGVRYFNGEIQLRVKDVGSDGFGIPWGHTRIYSNRLSNSYNFGNGTNWLVNEWPQLVRRKTDPVEVTKLHPSVSLQPTGCTIVFLRGTRNTIWFDEFKTGLQNQTQWRARFGAKHMFEVNLKRKNLRVITANGHKWEFYPFSTPCEKPADGHDPRLNGRLIRHVDPAGHSIVATYKDGLLQKFERSAEGTTETFSYEYFADGEHKGLLRYVTWTRGRPLERAEYTYYGTNEPYGSLGDLKTAKTFVSTSEGWQQRKDAVHYYRYEKTSEKASSGRTKNDTYCQGLLRHLVSPEAYHRLVLDGYKDPTIAEDSVVAKVADLTLEYYDETDSFSARRVRSAALYGGARCHTFQYRHANIKVGKQDVGYDLWHSTTTESRADDTAKVVTTNFIGQTLRHDLIDENKRWIHAWEYNPYHAGVDRFYYPSAIKSASYDQETSYPTFCSGNSAKARIRRLFHSPAKDWSVGFLTEVFEDQGLGGLEVHLNTFKYDTLSDRYNIYAIKQETRYGVGTLLKDGQRRNVDGTTRFSNTFQFSGKNVPDQDVKDGLALLDNRTTTLPDVSHEHFPGAAEFLPKGLRNTIWHKFDTFGNLVEAIDQRNTRTEHKVDVAKGSPIHEKITYTGRNGNSSLLVSYKSDDYGRVTEVLGPPHLATIDVNQPERTVRTATWYLHKVLSGEVWTAQGYAEGELRHCINPVAIKRVDLASRTIDEIVAVRDLPGRPQITETLPPQNKWVRWTHQEYDVGHNKVTNRVYHSIPPSGNGDVGLHFAETVTTSDIKGRQRKVSIAGGTHYEVKCEARGLPSSLTMWTSPSNSWQIATAEYDDGRDLGGNGNLIKLERSDRVTAFTYDFRDRQETVAEPDGTQVRYEYTAHGSVHKLTRGEQKKITGAATQAGPLRLLAEQTQLLDARGRVYLRQLNGHHYQDVTKMLEPLQEKFLYDEANQLVAFTTHGGRSAGEWTRTPVVAIAHDGMGRETVRRSLVYQTGMTALVLEQADRFFNAVGDPILVTTRSRLPDGSGEHLSSEGTWFDPLGRKLASSDFGSAALGGVRPGSVMPGRYPTTIFDLDENGQLARITDPLKHERRYGYDHAGRLVAQATNLEADQFRSLLHFGMRAPGLSDVQDDATVSQFSYLSENQLNTSAFVNTETGTQRSLLLYGKQESAPELSPPSACLPREFSDVLAPAPDRKMTIGYNSLGEIKEKVAANGTIHAYEYDKSGRIVCDRVKELGASAIDGRVRRIDYGYDEFGRLATIQSYSDRDVALPATLLNTVVRKYGTFNELIVEAQLHTRHEALNDNHTIEKDVFHGDAQAMSLRRAAFPAHIGYYYLYPNTSRNAHCLSSIWYPGDGATAKGRGRWVTRLFTPQDLCLGRVSSLAENVPPQIEPSRIKTTVDYGYCGTNSNYEIRMRRKSGGHLRWNLAFDKQRPFSSLDELGREWRRKWVRESEDGTTERLEVESLTRDFNNNVISRKNYLSPRDSDVYRYDRLDRLIDHHRGRVDLRYANPRAGEPKYQQKWRKDQSGNWRHWRRKDFLAPLMQTQARKHSLTNDIKQFYVTRWPTPEYDAAGLMTKFPQPNQPDEASQATYDAWGRLTKLVDGDGATTEFEYDGLGRRIVQRWFVGGQPEERHFYYDQAGRVISEALQVGNQRRLDREYVWDANDPLRLVCRLRYLPGSSEPERLYALDDITGRVVALADEDGIVKERFAYDPQGHVTFLDANFNERPSGQSSYEWEYLLGGMRYDRQTGFHFVGSGYYHADLGRPLPGGPISVLPESVVNSYAQDYPFGSWRPPGITGMQSAERMMKWIAEQPAWLKFSIGAAAMAITAGVVILTSLHNPYGVFMGIGAACGAIQGGVGAALSGGDYGDVMLSAGLGAVFGAVSPLGGIGSLGGSLLGISAAALARGAGEGWVTLSMGWEWGGLIGGVAGDVGQGAYVAAKLGFRRPLLMGLVGVGPDLVGAGVGGIIAHQLGGDLNTIYHGATMGMMAGGIAGGAARGLWGVMRAKSGSLTGSRARFRGEPFAFGSGTRSQRVEAIIAEAAEASGISDIYLLVDDVIYNPAGSYFTVWNGKRILSVGASAFERTKVGQVLEAAHEIVHAQQYQRFAARRFGGRSIDEAADAFFNVSDQIYARQERVAEHLARLRVRKYYGGLTPQEWAAGTRYINKYRLK